MGGVRVGGCVSIAAAAGRIRPQAQSRQVLDDFVQRREAVRAAEGDSGVKRWLLDEGPAAQAEGLALIGKYAIGTRVAGLGFYGTATFRMSMDGMSLRARTARCVRNVSKSGTVF